MPLPSTITPAVPVIVPATTEKTFDKARITSLRLNAGRANQPARLAVTMAFYRDVDAKTIEDHLATYKLRIDDLYKEADFDPEQAEPILAAIAAANPTEAMGIAVVAVQAAVEKYARAKEII